MTVRSCLLAGWLGCVGASVNALPATAQTPDRSEPRLINLAPQAASSNGANQRNADAVATALSRNAQLRGYHIDVVVIDGVAELHGKVADETQRDLAERTAALVAGVVQVSNQLTVATGSIAPAQDLVPNLAPVPIPAGPVPPPAAQFIPPAPGFSAGPLPPGVALPPLPPGAVAGAPAPVYQAQPGMLPNPQYQPPPLPPYAWPTYAPHNNYSRVAHPLQYAYNQWPFIGPMYPYPKVPLGWRRVTLEWQDGCWYYGREATSHDWWRVRYW